MRGDGGFGNPTMYAVCERLDITYTFGLSTNEVLKRESEALLAEAVRLMRAWWSAAAVRWLLVSSEIMGRATLGGGQSEANAHGTNRRFVVTNRRGARLYPEATYDEYVMRGESENRNKGLKCGLAIDRLSDHRFTWPISFGCICMPPR